MDKKVAIAVLICTLSVTPVSAKEFQNHTQMMEHGEGHLMDLEGAMVMGQNTDTLPGGCEKITTAKEITVHAGHKYAEKFPGTMYAFDQQEYQFEPCTKLTVHFINDDQIRHQWMMHGLPKYLYPKGMFHLEVSGPGEVSGTLILPPGDKTYLVHCDIAQHMEKGMKAQLKVGKGNEDLPSIPGVTGNIFPDDYSGKPYVAEKIPSIASPSPSASPAIAPAAAKTASDNGADNNSIVSGITVIGLALGLLISPWFAKRFKSMSLTEIFAAMLEMTSRSFGAFIGLLSRLLKHLSSNKSIPLPPK
jgi:hypothetical protein